MEEREGRRQHEGAHALLPKGRGASQNCTSFEVRVHSYAQKTTSVSNTCQCLLTYSPPPSPNNISIVLYRSNCKSYVIDVDRSVNTKKKKTINNTDRFG